MQRAAIPGYTGHVRGRGAEDVHGATHAKAAQLAAEAIARRSGRPGHLQGFLPEHPPRGATHASSASEFRVGRADSGSINMSTTGVDEGGFHASVRISGAEVPPQCRVVSTFHNPLGHGPRSGAAVPGYAGHVPGKYAGNVFAKRFAMSNLHASQVRQANHGTGLEWSTNWLLHSEGCRQQTAPGAASTGRSWRYSRAAPSRTASAGPGGWRLHEPAATHEWLEY